MLRILVRTNFAATKRRIDSILLEDGKSKLISCLAAIEAVMKITLLNAELGDIYPDIEVTLNGVDFNFLPARLETKLSEGDSLGISFITMGGG